MKNVADLYHLTPVQREMLSDANSARVAQVRWKLFGELDSEAFERAWQRLLARHAMLRTCFLTQLEDPVQVVRQQVKLPYERHDAQCEFVPAKAPLFQLNEIRLGERSYEFVLSHHPVLLDEHSAQLLFAEALTFYRGELRESDIAPAPSYRDYVAWIERQDLSGAERFWKLKDSSFASRANRNRDTGAGFSRQVNIGRAETHALKTFARHEGISLETLITAVWALTLIRDQGSHEVSIGVTAAERPRSLPQSQEMIGLLASVLPLPLAFTSEHSVLSWLQEVERKRTRLQRYAHVSQSQIREWLGLTEEVPLFDATVMFHESSTEATFTSNARTDSPLSLEATDGDELCLHLRASGSDAERSSIRVIEGLQNSLRALSFPWTTQIAPAPPPSEPDQPLEFSLFYFADDNAVFGEDKYRLYREGALFADRNGLTAVWTPERHFHEKAGLYPNPSVLSGALATITRNVQLRAGSVVLPLHHSLRVAEEWSVVDNLSNGRVGISFTSGWMPNDFAFFPERYANKREEMFRGIEEVQDLWRGKAIAGRDGAGKEIELRIFPKPIQAELPIWLTCSGGPEMFEKAGELGFNVLTALLTQSIEEVAPKIKLYRDALIRHGHDPAERKVTMMMHTFIGEDAEAVLHKVRVPLTKYLKSHLNLIETGAQSLNLEVDIAEQKDTEKYRDQMAAFAFERYYRTSSLIGTPRSCMKMVERLKSIGVDEVACLIDFGIDVDSVLESLDHLVVLRDLSNAVQSETALVSTAAHV